MLYIYALYIYAIYAIYECRTYHERIYVRYCFFCSVCCAQKEETVSDTPQPMVSTPCKGIQNGSYGGGEGGEGGGLLPIRGGLKYVRREVKNMATLLEDVHM